MDERKKDTKSPVMLPIVKIRKKRYFADSRLGELRNIRNHHDRLEFSNPEWVILKTFFEPGFTDRFLGEAPGGRP